MESCCVFVSKCEKAPRGTALLVAELVAPADDAHSREEKVYSPTVYKVRNLSMRWSQLMWNRCRWRRRPRRSCSQRSSPEYKVCSACPDRAETGAELLK